GLLGICYREAVGNVWISSSSAILGGYLPNVEPAARLPWRIAHEKGMDWIPAPLTTRQNGYKLLAMRTIDPRDGAIRPMRSAAADSRPGNDPRVFASAIKTLMGNWGRLDFQQRMVGLTAGFDTRSILAAATAAKINFQAFTDVHELLAPADQE